MEFQLHPASRRGAVRTLVLSERGEWVAVVFAALAALAAVSLWATVPTAARRALRADASASLGTATTEARRARTEVEARLAATRDRALDAGDLVSRIAFLYGVPVAGWPRSLNPETGLLAAQNPEAVAQGLTRYVASLDRGLVLLAEREASEPALAADTPSMVPLSSDLVEPASRFGPRVSPWTGGEEFFPGVDLAAPIGSPVVAPAAGTVVFAGRIPPALNARLWRFGNLVVLSHPSGAATVYGHLGRVDVRKGQRVRRGEPLGAVGTTGWAMFPALHYEYWRPGAEGLAPTDPRFAMLDLRLPGHDVSLERMAATSAPDSIQPPPGVAR
jgi:murein DD-endopeptidase MepM/ murein hydrolase activator NlpD